ncbi:hypothetical protein MJO28_004554 [Puccinia striiformis f. sp. tritici]|uniref:Protein phosphatase 2 (Formerly 2A), regulatory subunit A n=2 Tax=Puccinia striiformis f. sp. tritici TaxID=168172 RepID=A0A0L0VAQ0_9BASI|nr:hypothetical protein Pst134EA_006848 [Puccinia striiformis f. sp. tritici]KAI9627668.1 hypothetical protein H4Q26_017235 [Puccinia striiformis f. sp. tritici PST-130]KNE96358.1 protein phosphatase 2 (formerly 2A), regulatory subunit A [Puccinia striiformis f. sp. tritici PST-78]KAH9459778.1 hypothetical protein Pst134EB_008006 [Puccinia striiformis f. sp. tritici]KAH9469555.1 hypothetical protein Pst134EA_006848 [Puccinia striiformis f. sp. tritici]KAI7957459.1 hypothetical protein MJO28_00
MMAEPQQINPAQFDPALVHHAGLTGMHPLAVLIDELKSDDVSARLTSIHRLTTIALALGPQRTRDELVPFITEGMDDEDEVLLALAGELNAAFVEFLGGPEYAHLLLVPLENLGTVEETLIRDKAAESLTQIAALLSAQQLEEFYVPAMKRLSVAEWFTSRATSTSLYAAAYPKVSEATQDEMRRMYTALCTDETPMVRRAAAKELGPFAKALSQSHLVTDAIPVFRKLAGDDQDSVRLLTVDALIAIASSLPDKGICKQQLGATMKAMVSDKSWRVRYMIADHFVQLAESAGEDVVREELVGAYVHLLKDNEAEVRTAAAGQIPGFCKLIDREVILSRVLICVRELASDTSQYVRAALGTQVAGLAPLLGKEATIEHLLSLFLQLLKDEFADVRLNIISKLEQVNEVIGIELLSQALLPAIMELSEDKQWRVRQAIIEYIPLLATQLGVSFFDDQLAGLCMAWLNDAVYSIRESATINLRKLTEVFGVEWAKSTILPKVLAMAKDANYLHRMTTIFAIRTMAPALDVEVIKGSVLDTVISLVNDPIPNIRFNTAKAFQTLAITVAGQPGGKEVARDKILPNLIKLRDDSDADVKFFTEEALADAAAVASGEQAGARDTQMK